MFVVIPMAGRGTRTEAYGEVKPLIPFRGIPMVQRAIESLGFVGAQHIFIVREYESDEIREQLKFVLELSAPGCIICEVDYVTDGPACSALLAKEWIDTDEPLIVTNCDQIMKWDSEKFVEHLTNLTDDGLVVTYDTQKLKNSSIRLDENGYGLEVREKQIIGPESLNGIHYWARGEDFVWSTEQMVEKDDRVNGEFYIAPTYNYLIERGMKISTYPIPYNQHWATGTINDIQQYIRGLDEDS